MWKMFHGRWKIVMGFVTALIFLAGLNIAISQVTIDIAPLSVDAPSFALAIKGNDDVSLQLFSDLDSRETFTRPVFSPTRRNFVEPTSPSVESDAARVELEPEQIVPMEPPPIKLLGTRVVDGKRAVLIDLEDRAGAWLSEGDTIGGWKISSISVDAISLNSGAQNMVISLYE